MKRREFITLLGGAAIVASGSASAQPAGKVRRIGFMETLPRRSKQILSGRFARRCAISAMSKAGTLSLNIVGRKETTSASRRWWRN